MGPKWRHLEQEGTAVTRGTLFWTRNHVLDSRRVVRHCHHHRRHAELCPNHTTLYRSLKPCRLDFLHHGLSNARQPEVLWGKPVLGYPAW